MCATKHRNVFEWHGGEYSGKQVLILAIIYCRTTSSYRIAQLYNCCIYLYLLPAHHVMLHATSIPPNLMTFIHRSKTIRNSTKSSRRTELSLNIGISIEGVKIKAVGLSILHQYVSSSPYFGLFAIDSARFRVLMNITHVAIAIPIPGWLDGGNTHGSTQNLTYFGRGTMCKAFLGKFNNEKA